MLALHLLVSLTLHPRLFGSPLLKNPVSALGFFPKVSYFISFMVLLLYGTARRSQTSNLYWLINIDKLE